MFDAFTRFIDDEAGATAIEYALMAALIAIAIITGATAMAGSVENLYKSFTGKVNAAPSA